MAIADLAEGKYLDAMRSGSAYLRDVGAMSPLSMVQETAYRIGELVPSSLSETFARMNVSGAKLLTAIPVMGEVASTVLGLIDVVESISAQQQASTAAACRYALGLLPEPSGSPLGGCDMCATDLFAFTHVNVHQTAWAGNPYWDIAFPPTIGQALMALSEGTAIPPSTYDLLVAQGELPAPTIDGQPFSMGDFWVGRRCEPPIDEAGRQELARLREAIQLARYTDGDGGEKAFTLWLDLFHRMWYPGEGTWPSGSPLRPLAMRQMIRQCVFFPEPPDADIGPGFEAACVQPLAHAVDELLRMWHRTIRPNYEAGMVALEQAEAEAKKQLQRAAFKAMWQKLPMQRRRPALPTRAPKRTRPSQKKQVY